MLAINAPRLVIVDFRTIPTLATDIHVGWAGRVGGGSIRSKIIRGTHRFDHGASKTISSLTPSARDEMFAASLPSSLMVADDTCFIEGDGPDMATAMTLPVCCIRHRESVRKE